MGCSAPWLGSSTCCRFVLSSLQVVNCVGLMNYKFFLQFLLYTCVATVVAIACLIQPMLTFFSGKPGGRWGPAGASPCWENKQLLVWLSAATASCHSS